MKIGTIFTECDENDNVNTRGTVGYASNSVYKEGTTNGRDWSFWGQFVVLKDETGEIGVSLALNQEQGVQKGDAIGVQGKYVSYTNNKNETAWKIQGKITAPQQANKPATAAPAAKPTGISTNDSIIRQCAGKCVARLVAGNIVAIEDRFTEAKMWVDFFKGNDTPKAKLPEQPVKNVWPPDEYPEGVE